MTDRDLYFRIIEEREQQGQEDWLTFRPKFSARMTQLADWYFKDTTSEIHTWETYRKVYKAANDDYNDYLA